MKIKEIEVKDILTKTNIPIGDFAINPYVGCSHGCKYCYASFMKRFTGHTEPWGTFIDAKSWKSINKNKVIGKELFFGSVTDPYLPEEATYKRTRKVLEELQGLDVEISIQTKSDLVLRDIDLLKTFKHVRVGFSINTLDESFKNDMDNAVSIKRRIDAMKKLHNEGILTTCFISPIFPGITDVISIINEVKNCCNLIWLENLNLRGDYKGRIMSYIKDKYSKLYPLYDDIYNKKNRNYWIKLNQEIEKYTKENNLSYVRNDDSNKYVKSDKPVVVNFFYHEEVKKNAKKE